MKIFKIIDIWISATLVITALMLLPFFPNYAFLLGYLGVGAWHIMSMLVHYFYNWFMDKTNSRVNYH